MRAIQPVCRRRCVKKRCRRKASPGSTERHNREVTGTQRRQRRTAGRRLGPAVQEHRSSLSRETPISCSVENTLRIQAPRFRTVRCVREVQEEWRITYVSIVAGHVQARVL